MEKTSVVSRVYDALDEDVYLRKSIELGIANLSALSSKIRKDCVPDSTKEAVRAAVRRYVAESDLEDSDKELEKLLRNTEFSLKSNISVIQAFKERSVLSKLQAAFKRMGDEMNIISSSQAITIITGDQNVREIIATIGRNNIIELRKNLHAIYLNSGKNIKSVPGFVAYITGLLLRKKINLIEFYSCYTDTVLIVSREDSLKTYGILDNVICKSNHKKDK